MDYKRRIGEIRARAEALGLPIRTLVHSAGGQYSTFQRWQAEGANPRFRDMNDTLGRIEARLEEHECAVLAQLARRWPEQAVAALDAIEREGAGQ